MYDLGGGPVMSEQNEPDWRLRPNTWKHSPQEHLKSQEPHQSFVTPESQESNRIRENSGFLYSGQRRFPKGIWYLLLPLLSLGLLASIPFFHAYKKLRDRNVLIMGCVFCAMSISWIVISNISYDFKDSSTWLKLVVAGCFLYPLIAGTAQAASLRRRVYLGIPKVIPKVIAKDYTVNEDKGEAIRAAIELSDPSERKLSTVTDWGSFAVALFVLAFFAVVIPAAGVVLTLTGKSNYFIENGILDTLPIIAIAVAGSGALIVWLTVKYTPDKGVARLVIALATAVSVNLYIGISIWVVASKIASAAISPHKLGLMVWWNLSDSVPFVNVNSTLDWKQPVTEYGARLGWLFLFQKIILLLTLARVIKIIVDQYLNYSKQKEDTSEKSPKTRVSTK
jgi:hypothetical protein